MNKINPSKKILLALITIISLSVSINAVASKRYCAHRDGVYTEGWADDPRTAATNAWDCCMRTFNDQNKCGKSIYDRWQAEPAVNDTCPSTQFRC